MSQDQPTIIEIRRVFAGLERAMLGDADPSLFANEFSSLVQSLASLSAGNSDQRTRLSFELIGRRAAELLLDRLRSSMESERAIALMRSDNKPL